MVTSDPPVADERIACAICLKEVPISEALVPEATDYVVHFCGLDCYDKWRHQGEKPDASGKPPPT